jgi:3-hydroxyisobutyrate dehydrogenase-like beta-hydroxyacid dehydrogenase
VYIDMSTVGPHTIRSIAARFPKRVAVVDAPVRGSISQAAEGRLEIFVGAADEDFTRVRPILESLGSVGHVGGPGAGAAMKLIANLALGVSIAAVGESTYLFEGSVRYEDTTGAASRRRGWRGVVPDVQLSDGSPTGADLSQLGP